MMQGLKALPPNVFEETIGGLVHGLVRWNHNVSKVTKVFHYLLNLSLIAW